MEIKIGYNMERIRVENIFFDMDGTLYSSEMLIYKAYERGINNFKSKNRKYMWIKVPSKTKMLGVVGYPVDDIYRILFPNLISSEREELRSYVHIEFINAIKSREGILYKGVERVIKALYRSAKNLYIASNGTLEYIQTILTTYRLNGLFGRVEAIDNESIFDKGDILLRYKELYNLNSKKSLMIGDRKSDLDAAIKFGCKFIHCAYGHGQDDNIAVTKDMQISTMQQLPERLATL